MALGIIPLLLIMIPAVLSALAVVREKELGSIVNFYVTPVTRLEFLLGTQLPYIVLGFASFLFSSSALRWRCSAFHSRAAFRPTPWLRCFMSRSRPAWGS